MAGIRTCDRESQVQRPNHYTTEPPCYTPVSFIWSSAKNVQSGGWKLDHHLNLENVLNIVIDRLSMLLCASVTNFSYRPVFRSLR